MNIVATPYVRTDGNTFAALMTARLSTEVAEAVAKTGHVPGLAFVLVGENPASQGYLRAKHRATATAGMQSRATPRKLDSDGSYDLKSAGL